MIQLKNLTKTYGAKQTAFTALDDVSFSIPEGATVAIVGRSGSGKSTLMHVISGLDRPQKGEVIIGDQNILKWPEARVDDFRARQMSFVFQAFFVEGNETCRDNVALPLEIGNSPASGREAKIDQALRAVDLIDKKTVLAKNLSGGQKQRLAIARAIVNQPRVLFADEPTGNLDTATGTKIINLLFTYSQQNSATLFIVTHDESLAAKCQYQIFLEDGQLVKIVDSSPAKAKSALRKAPKTQKTKRSKQ